MNINKEYIKSLSPCCDRFKNYLNHHAKWSGSLSEFLDLDKITHRDKVWVFVRCVSPDLNRKFAIEVAEGVLNLFEEKYPNDKRPRNAIAAARLFLGGGLPQKEAARAAAHAASDAAYAASDAAADAAAAAAANAARAARAHASYAAASAADAANAAYAAAHAAYAAAHAAYAAAHAHDAALASAADGQKSMDAQLNLMKRYAELN